MNIKTLPINKIPYLLILVMIMGFQCIAFAQKINLTGENISFETAIDAIRKQTDYTVFISKKEFKEAKPITIHAVNMELNQYLKEISKFEPFAFTIENKAIAFSKIQTKQNLPKNKQKSIVGEIRRKDNNQVIERATLRIKNTLIQGHTNSQGVFFLIVDANIENPTLLVSYIGMKDLEIELHTIPTKPLTILLEEQQETIEDVVVTGIFNRKKESFSGSSATFSNKELKMASGTGVLQSINILDPSFKIIQNNQFGSDPNQQLNIEIRGKTSVAGLDDAYGLNPNQPLFILDGFESTMERIRDISMDRVQSVTILKDATATSMYGAKGANGVVVVETIKPKPGKLGLSYNLTSNIQLPDLSDYNLMNASEKLQFELLSQFYGRINDKGEFTDNLYNREDIYFDRLKEVKRGVNTYWLNEPLRTGISQTHNLNIYGGDPTFQYSIGLSKTIRNGVMNKSGNDISDGLVSLTYRNGNFSFTNQLNVRMVKSSKEPVSFSQFASANPYFRKYNAEGGIDKILVPESYIDSDMYNPLYDYKNNNIENDDNQEIINNFNIDWAIIQGLNFKVNIGYSQVRNGHIKFRSPHNTEFLSKSMEQKGTYMESTGKIWKYNSLATLTYGKIWNKHTLNLVSGASLNSARNYFSAFDTEGFFDDKIINPSFAFGYKDGGLPLFQDQTRRESGFLLNANYGYDNRFIFDGNYRLDGSSIYGSNKNLTAIWSVGGYWNLSKEKIFQGTSSWLQSLRLRASYGNLGNQNFKDYISLAIYQYSKMNVNPFGPGVVIENFGNPDLKWQKTLNQNYGLDMITFNDRFRLTFNAYFKNTDPLLVYLTTPTSSGRKQLIQNLGALKTKGLELDVNIAPIMNQNFIWRIAALVSKNKSVYHNIGNSLEEYNKTNRSKNLQRFYDGGSPDDLWAVKSLGIDPATGKEMFQKINGEETFIYDYADEVKLGNSRPSYDGNFSTSIYYKGFQFFASFRYQLGGQAFMSTLYQKVENIGYTQIKYNQDKRALYDRWQKPGDIANFKAINETSYTPISSRFIQNNNIFTLQSVSLNYETKTLKWLEKIHVKSLRFGLNSNELLYIASIKNERGIDYPFARDITFNLGLSF